LRLEIRERVQTNEAKSKRRRARAGGGGNSQSVLLNPQGDQGPFLPEGQYPNTTYSKVLNALPQQLTATQKHSERIPISNIYTAT
jgi:hypothetical protein